MLSKAEETSFVRRQPCAELLGIVGDWSRTVFRINMDFFVESVAYRFLLTIWKTWESERIVNYTEPFCASTDYFLSYFFFTRSDLDETSCFIRVQMLGVTLPCHQTICAMAEYFPDFSLVFFFSFIYWPTSLAWPRRRIWKRPPGFNWSRTTRVSNRTNHMEIESEVSEPRYW